MKAKARKKLAAIRMQKKEKDTRTKIVRCVCGKCEIEVGYFAARTQYCDECRPQEEVKVATLPPVYVVDLEGYTAEELVGVLGEGAQVTKNGGVYMVGEGERYLFSGLTSGFRWMITWDEDNQPDIVSTQGFMSHVSKDDGPLARHIRERLKTVSKVIHPKAS